MYVIGPLPPKMDTRIFFISICIIAFIDISAGEGRTDREKRYLSRGYGHYNHYRMRANDNSGSLNANGGTVAVSPVSSPYVQNNVNNDVTNGPTGEGGNNDVNSDYFERVQYHQQRHYPCAPEVRWTKYRGQNRRYKRQVPQNNRLNLINNEVNSTNPTGFNGGFGYGQFDTSINNGQYVNFDHSGNNRGYIDFGENANGRAQRNFGNGGVKDYGFDSHFGPFMFNTNGGSGGNLGTGNNYGSGGSNFNNFSSGYESKFGSSNNFNDFDVFDNNYGNYDNYENGRINNERVSGIGSSYDSTARFASNSDSLTHFVDSRNMGFGRDQQIHSGFGGAQGNSAFGIGAANGNSGTSRGGGNVGMSGISGSSSGTGHVTTGGKFGSSGTNNNDFEFSRTSGFGFGSNSANRQTAGQISSGGNYGIGGTSNTISSTGYGKGDGSSAYGSYNNNNAFGFGRNQEKSGYRTDVSKGNTAGQISGGGNSGVGRTTDFVGGSTHVKGVTNLGISGTHNSNFGVNVNKSKGGFNFGSKTSSGQSTGYVSSGKNLNFGKGHSSHGGMANVKGEGNIGLSGTHQSDIGFGRTKSTGGFGISQTNGNERTSGQTSRGGKIGTGEITGTNRGFVRFQGNGKVRVGGTQNNDFEFSKGGFVNGNSYTTGQTGIGKNFGIGKERGTINGFKNVNGDENFGSDFTKNNEYRTGGFQSKSGFSNSNNAFSKHSTGQTSGGRNFGYNGKIDTSGKISHGNSEVNFGTGSDSTQGGRFNFNRFDGNKNLVYGGIHESGYSNKQIANERHFGFERKSSSASGSAHVTGDGNFRTGGNYNKGYGFDEHQTNGGLGFSGTSGRKQTNTQTEKGRKFGISERTGTNSGSGYIHGTRKVGTAGTLNSANETKKNGVILNGKSSTVHTSRKNGVSGNYGIGRVSGSNDVSAKVTGGANLGTASSHNRDYELNGFHGKSGFDTFGKIGNEHSTGQIRGGQNFGQNGRINTAIKLSHGNGRENFGTGSSSSQGSRFSFNQFGERNTFGYHDVHSNSHSTGQFRGEQHLGSQGTSDSTSSSKQGDGRSVTGGAYNNGIRFGGIKEQKGNGFGSTSGSGYTTGQSNTGGKSRIGKTSSTNIGSDHVAVNGKNGFAATQNNDYEYGGIRNKGGFVNSGISSRGHTIGQIDTRGMSGFGESSGTKGSSANVNSGGRFSTGSTHNSNLKVSTAGNQNNVIGNKGNGRFEIEGRGGSGYKTGQINVARNFGNVKASGTKGGSVKVNNGVKFVSGVTDNNDLGIGGFKRKEGFGIGGTRGTGRLSKNTGGEERIGFNRKGSINSEFSQAKNYGGFSTGGTRNSDIGFNGFYGKGGYSNSNTGGNVQTTGQIGKSKNFGSSRTSGTNSATARVQNNGKAGTTGTQSSVIGIRGKGAYSIGGKSFGGHTTGQIGSGRTSGIYSGNSLVKDNEKVHTVGTNNKDIGLVGIQGKGGFGTGGKVSIGRKTDHSSVGGSGKVNGGANFGTGFSHNDFGHGESLNKGVVGIGRISGRDHSTGRIVGGGSVGVARGSSSNVGFGNIRGGAKTGSGNTHNSDFGIRFQGKGGRANVETSVINHNRGQVSVGGSLGSGGVNHGNKGSAYVKPGGLVGVGDAKSNDIGFGRIQGKGGYSSSYNQPSTGRGGGNVGIGASGTYSGSAYVMGGGRNGIGGARNSDFKVGRIQGKEVYNNGGSSGSGYSSGQNGGGGNFGIGGTSGINGGSANFNNDGNYGIGGLQSSPAGSGYISGSGNFGFDMSGGRTGSGGTLNDGSLIGSGVRNGNFHNSVFNGRFGSGSQGNNGAYGTSNGFGYSNGDISNYGDNSYLSSFGNRESLGEQGGNGNTVNQGSFGGFSNYGENVNLGGFGGRGQFGSHGGYNSDGGYGSSSSSRCKRYAPYMYHSYTFRNHDNVGFNNVNGGGSLKESNSNSPPVVSNSSFSAVNIQYYGYNPENSTPQSKTSYKRQVTHLHVKSNNNKTDSNTINRPTNNLLNNINVVSQGESTGTKIHDLINDKNIAKSTAPISTINASSKYNLNPAASTETSKNDFNSPRNVTHVESSTTLNSTSVEQNKYEAKNLMDAINKNDKRTVPDGN